jgi:hypothetical protein
MDTNMLGSGCVPKCVGLGGVPQPKGVLGCMPNTSWVCLAQQGWVCYAQCGGVHPAWYVGLGSCLSPCSLGIFFAFIGFFCSMWGFVCPIYFLIHHICSKKLDYSIYMYFYYISLQQCM